MTDESTVLVNNSILLGFRRLGVNTLIRRTTWDSLMVAMVISPQAWSAMVGYGDRGSEVFWRYGMRL